MANSQSAGDSLNSNLQYATTSALSSEDYHGPAPALAHILISLDLPLGSTKLSPELEREEFHGDGNLYELVRIVLRGRSLYGRSITFLQLSMTYLTCNATLARIMQRGGLGYPGIPTLNGRRGVKKLGDLFEVMVSIHFRHATYQASLAMVEHTFGHLINALEVEYQRLGGDQHQKSVKRPRDPADDADVNASRSKRARIKKPIVDENTQPPNAHTRKNRKKRSRKTVEHTIPLLRGHRPMNKRDRELMAEPANGLSRAKRAWLVEPVADENIQPLNVLTSGSRRGASYTSGKHGSGSPSRRKQPAGRLVQDGKPSLADCTTSMNQDKSVTAVSINMPMPSSASSTSLNQSAGPSRSFALPVKPTHSGHYCSSVQFSNDGNSHHYTQARPSSSSTRNSSFIASPSAIKPCTETSSGRSSSSASSSWLGCNYGVNDYEGIHPHSGDSWLAAPGFRRGPDDDSHRSGKRSWQQRENIGDPDHDAPYVWTGNSNHSGGGDRRDRYWPHDDRRVGTRDNEPKSSASLERSQKRQRRHSLGGA